MADREILHHFRSGRLTNARAIADVTGADLSTVRRVLDEDEIYQKTAPPAPPLKIGRRWIVHGGPGTSLHADLMSVSRMYDRANKIRPAKDREHFTFLYVCVDQATRYLVASLCANKKPEHVAAMARRAHARFPFPIPNGAVLITDSGNEFGRPFRQAFDTDDHTIVVKEASHTYGARLAETVIHTLRKLVAIHSMQDPEDRPTADLEFAVDAYNERRHGAFRGELTPTSAATRVTPSELQMLHQQYQPERPPAPAPRFAVGDIVRVRRVRSIAFEKSNDEPPWSSMTFRVTEHEVLDGVNTYRVMGHSHERGRLFRDRQTDATMRKVTGREARAVE